MQEPGSAQDGATGGLTLLMPGNAQTQTLTSMAATSNTSAGINGNATTVSTTNAAPFFGGFSPTIKLAQPPVNFSSPRCKRGSIISRP